VCRLHVPRELSVCWHVSRAERASSFSFLCRDLSVHRLHVPSRIKRWVCVCILWLGSRAEVVCIFQHVSRADCVSAFGGLCRELSVCVHVSARIEG
jgi:hypothetical protein